MFGLFRRKKEPEQRIPLASPGIPNLAPQQESEHKAFSIALSWKGLFGLLLVFFILQMWMFLLGMWAAQTIVFPTSALPAPAVEKEVESAIEPPQEQAPAQTDDAGQQTQESR